MLLLALTASGSRTVGASRRTQMFASIGMPCVCAPGVREQIAPRRCERLAALGYQIRRAATQRCQEVCSVSGRIHPSRLDHSKEQAEHLLQGSKT